VPLNVHQKRKRNLRLF